MGFAGPHHGASDRGGDRSADLGRHLREGCRGGPLVTECGGDRDRARTRDAHVGRTVIDRHGTPSGSGRIRRVLRGRHFWNKRTREDLVRAADYFRAAIDRDPTYAPAYAGLADAYALLGTIGYDALRPDDAMPAPPRRHWSSTKDSHRRMRPSDTSSCRSSGTGRGGSALHPRHGDQSSLRDGALGTATASSRWDRWSRPRGRCSARRSSIRCPCRATSVLAGPSTISEYDEAIAQHKRTLEIAPDLPMVLYELGLAYQNSGRVRGCARRLREGLRTVRR